MTIKISLISIKFTREYSRDSWTRAWRSFSKWMGNWRQPHSRHNRAVRNKWNASSCRSTDRWIPAVVQDSRWNLKKRNKLEKFNYIKYYIPHSLDWPNPNQTKVSFLKGLIDREVSENISLLSLTNFSIHFKEIQFHKILYYRFPTGLITKRNFLKWSASHSQKNIRL